MSRHHRGFFFVRRHGTPFNGRAVRGSASCAGSLTRYANLHGSAHPDWRRGRRKLSTAVKGVFMLNFISNAFRILQCSDIALEMIT